MAAAPQAAAYRSRPQGGAMHGQEGSRAAQAVGTRKGAVPLSSQQGALDQQAHHRLQGRRVQVGGG